MEEENEDFYNNNITPELSDASDDDDDDDQSADIVDYESDHADDHYQIGDYDQIQTNNSRYSQKKVLGSKIRFSNPYDICVDNEQELIFVCDSGNSAIQVYDLHTYEWKYKIDCGKDIPFYIEYDPTDSCILFGSNDNYLYKYSVFGKLIWKISTTGSTSFNLPSGMAIDFNAPERPIYLCDQGNSRVLKLKSSDGDFMSEFGCLGHGDLEFVQTRNICFDNEGQYLLVVDRYNHRVQIVTRDGKFVKSFGRRGSGPCEFNEPCSICVEKRTGNIYVSDSFNDRIQIFTSDGDYLESVNGLNYPLGISLNDKNGDLLVTEWRSGLVRILKDNFFTSRYEEHIRRKLLKTTCKFDIIIKCGGD